ncbi:MAG: hypothetical protein M9933_06355 [Chitinophagaceae bacterium]|nr:hypothetical protein [Chitinophagaceae bacterium]
MLLQNARRYYSFFLKSLVLFILLQGTGNTSVFAAGPPSVSVMNNVLVWTLIALMLILLIAIFLLGNILLGLSESVRQTRKKEKSTPTLTTAIVTGFLVFVSVSVMAQEDPGTLQSAVATPKTYGGHRLRFLYNDRRHFCRTTSDSGAVVQHQILIERTAKCR